jgi:hypothetical protein
VCNFEFDLGGLRFPRYYPADGSTAHDFLRRLTMEGVQRRYAQKGILGTGTSSTLCDTRSCHKPALQIRTKGPGIMSGRTSGKEKQQSPQRCPKCGATANLTVSVTVIPDGSSVLGDRVVWDNDTATKCGACGFIGKVADFEPTDSYSPENEEEMENRVAGMYGFVLKRSGAGSRFSG